QSTQQRPIRDPVQGGVEKRSEGRALVRPSRDGAVQNIEQRGHAKKPAPRPNVTRGVDGAAGDGAKRADGGDGVRMDSAADQPIGDRIDELQVSVLEPVRENLHAARLGRNAPSPDGAASRVKVALSSSCGNRLNRLGSWQREYVCAGQNDVWT